MDKKRAKKIASSPIMANVIYEGTPIYIENVNDIKGTASIYPLDQPGNRQEVSITNLVEQ